MKMTFPCKKIKDCFKILIEHEIVRRYVIINSFDGALTILGILFAEFFSGITNPKLIILPGIGAAVAMCVSGVWGAYAAERAEVRQKIRTMEAHLMKDLSGTEFSKKREGMAVIIGVVDGLSPLVVSLLIIAPFFCVAKGWCTMTHGYIISFSVVALVLFVLGVFAGKIAKENVIKQGIVMLLAGGIIGLLFMLMAFFGIL